VECVQGGSVGEAEDEVIESIECMFQILAAASGKFSEIAPLQASRSALPGLRGSR
jgi:hypothetical protein